MKRFLVFLLSALLVLSLAACGGDKEPTPSGGGTTDPGSQQTDPGTSQQPSSGDTDTPDPGATSGEIVTGGEAGAAAPSTVTLPANVKMEISMDGNLDQTTIKIGNDYYMKDRYGDQTFFKYKAEDEWVQYDFSDGAWDESEYVTYDEVIDICFNNIGRYTDSMGVDPVTTGRSQVIAGNGKGIQV